MAHELAHWLFQSYEASSTIFKSRILARKEKEEKKNQESN